MTDEIKLIPATERDAGLIHSMQCEAFLPLYEKYHDDDTSPVKESIQNVIRKIQKGERKSDYYLIRYQNQTVGAVRATEERNKRNGREKDILWISPIFILPEYQNRGIGYTVIQKLFQLYDHVITWRLYTILQEAGNCHFYEKCGFVKTGKEKKVNDAMTLAGYEKSNISVRQYEDTDAEAVADLLIRNFKEVNSRDYGKKAMDELAGTHNAQWVRQLTSYAHMYIFCIGEEIVGCGSISSYFGSKTESILLTVFVLPEYHGVGIGRLIIRTLEQDEFFTRAERIEIPASITAVEFYRKFGYDFKNGVKELDGEGHYRLEKFREKG